MPKYNEKAFPDAIELEISGWSEEGEDYTNVPKVCSKCGGKLHKTDALKLCNILFVYCDEGKLHNLCRWCQAYYLP
jgi:hypothetical protein